MEMDLQTVDLWDNEHAVMLFGIALSYTCA
jgi:hypothetical protein